MTKLEILEQLAIEAQQDLIKAELNFKYVLAKFESEKALSEQSEVDQPETNKT